MYFLFCFPREWWNRRFILSEWKEKYLWTSSAQPDHSTDKETEIGTLQYKYALDFLMLFTVSTGVHSHTLGHADHHDRHTTNVDFRTTTLEICLAISQKIKLHLPYGPPIPPLDIYSGGMNLHDF